MRINCGVMEVTVGENDELLLDCFQPWHQLTTNFKSYIFAKAPLGTRSHWHFETMVETQESSLEFLRVQKEHEKTYHCVVMGNEGKNIARTLYDVHVGDPIPEATEPTFTRPSLGTELLPATTRAPLQSERLSALNLGSILAIVVLSISVLALGGLLCYSTVGCQKRPGVDRSREWMELLK
ncbi:izumo sperm-egg fusion protein 1-like [Mobula birostris]|uniref:izumo sperm-egg fusion protein 1-like n=1 Tax=Mobula birostris TaxID=1983395 RepID=UPI003B27F62C